VKPRAELGGGRWRGFGAEALDLPSHRGGALATRARVTGSNLFSKPAGAQEPGRILAKAAPADCRSHRDRRAASSPTEASALALFSAAIEVLRLDWHQFRNGVTPRRSWRLGAQRGSPAKQLLLK
jgi:hypothetical protein